MRLSIALGFAAIFSLVQGCSSAGSTTPGDPTSGEPNPEQPTDPGGDPPAGDTTPTPGSSGGNPTPTPTTPGTPPEPPAPPPKPKSTMTFFVTSTGTGALGGNIGGLIGADKKCQDLAVAVNAGDHTWHAYLSVTGTNAKDRIGPGPWTNQKGKVISPNLIALHDYQFIPANADLVDEKGVIVPKNRSSILTGTKLDGTPALQNCQNWTSAAANQQGRIGDAAADTNPNLGVRWNDANKSNACTQAALNQNNGEGRLYCFAID